MATTKEQVPWDGTTGSMVVDAASLRWRLVQLGPSGPLMFPLNTPGVTVVGRSRQVDCPVEDTSISRRHVAISARADGLAMEFRVEDLGSANGTRLNGTRLIPGQAVVLRPGEVLEMGHCMVVVQAAAPEPVRVLSAAAWMALVDVLTARGTVFGVLHAESAANPERLIESLPAGSGASACVMTPGSVVVLFPAARESAALAAANGAAQALAARHAEVVAHTTTSPQGGMSTRVLLEAVKCAVPSRSAPLVLDPAMKDLFDKVDRVATGNIHTLVLGETGVGKDVVARAIHDRSQRAGARWVAVNCGALTDSLLQSELFGHERGAFTGATTARAGLFETAHGGTLFLDEVGDLAPETQVQLLRVIEDKTVRRLGGAEARPADVRIITATNQPLGDMVAQGTFRRDLYYRLAAYVVRVPPLRSRLAEILPLAERFAQQSALEQQLPPPQIGPEARAALLAHPWPGNIRELRNVMQRAVALAQRRAIEPEHLGLEAQDAASATQRDLHVPDRGTLQAEVTAPPNVEGAALPGEMDDLERRRILQAMEQHAGNQTRAAQALGISRKALIGRLAKYNVARPRQRQN